MKRAPSLWKVISFCSVIALALIYFGLNFLNKVASVCNFYCIAQNALPVPFSNQKRRQTNTEDNPSYCVNQLFIHKCDGWFRLRNLISRFQFIFTMYMQWSPILTIENKSLRTYVLGSVHDFDVGTGPNCCRCRKWGRKKWKSFGKVS